MCGVLCARVRRAGASDRASASAFALAKSARRDDAMCTTRLPVDALPGGTRGAAEVGTQTRERRSRSARRSPLCVSSRVRMYQFVLRLHRDGYPRRSSLSRPSSPSSRIRAHASANARLFPASGTPPCPSREASHPPFLASSSAWGVLSELRWRRRNPAVAIGRGCLRERALRLRIAVQSRSEW